eukprot:GSMAST32.ASY1.ANO1.2286.1 assembled CDS
MYRKHSDLLKTLQNAVLVCDEGHRLKSKSSTKTMYFKSAKRLILTGTPLQNNLEEFWAMINFVNPGVLGDIEAFRNMYLFFFLQKNRIYFSYEISYLTNFSFFFLKYFSKIHSN